MKWQSHKKLLIFLSCFSAKLQRVKNIGIAKNMPIIFMFAIMIMGICLNNFYEDFLSAIELCLQHKALLFRATLFLTSLIGLLLIAYANFFWILDAAQDIIASLQDRSILANTHCSKRSIPRRQRWKPCHQFTISHLSPSEFLCVPKLSCYSVILKKKNIWHYLVTLYAAK